MGDSGGDSSVTGGWDIGDSVLDAWGTSCREMGDQGPALETMDVRDMGDTETSCSADALENDLPHG
jgi:hypothetical protein